MAAPTAHADVRIRDLRVGATKIGEALGVDSTATVDIGDGRGDITAKLGDGPELALTGRLSIPVSFAVQPFSFRLAGDAPVSGRLGGQADLALLPRVIDLRGDQLGGRLSVDMSIGGTVAVPRLGGDLQVADGSYASARTGATLRDVTAALAGDNDRLVLRSLTASDGGAGRLSASGSATLGSPGQGTLRRRAYAPAVHAPKGRRQHHRERPSCGSTRPDAAGGRRQAPLCGDGGCR